jgi:hypothetical protein
MVRKFAVPLAVLLTMVDIAIIAAVIWVAYGIWMLRTQGVPIDLSIYGIP